MVKLTLPTDSTARKDIPLVSGCLDYAPAALAGMARWSKVCNEKHNKGQPLHHSRGKSSDHADTIVRHLMDIRDLMKALERGDYRAAEQEAALKQLKDDLDALTWRAAILSQEAHEKYFGAPLAPGARVAELVKPSAREIAVAEGAMLPAEKQHISWSASCLGEACGFGDIICQPCKQVRDTVERHSPRLVHWGNE